mmetsp:Transcript_5596/g.21054  ORF Transcript_5596/g.21054 Transcript_5596/m.21054 type:complete len:137 (-) Transcript_5596:200-610(-)
MKNKTQTIEEEIIYKKAKIYNKSNEKKQKVKVIYSAPKQADVEVIEMIEPASFVEVPVKEYIVEEKPYQYGIKEIELITDQVVERPVRIEPSRIVREEIIEERSAPRTELFEVEINNNDSGCYELYPRREMRILEA